MIQIENATKHYGGILALDNLSLEIKPGEIFAFLGPNGAGKTTTVRLLCGLLFPDQGRIRINGVDIAENPLEAKRHIGLVPDEPHAYPKLTAWEFLELIAQIFNCSDWREPAQKYLELFDLSRAINSRTLLESYSHGMKQKVIWTSLLMRRPKVWLLDEPLVGLDPKSIKTVKKLIEEGAKQGSAIFLSTHVLSVAEEIAHRIGIIQMGKVDFIGTKKELEGYLRGKNLSLNEGESLENLFLKATLREA